MAVTFLDNLRELVPYFQQYAILYVSETNPKGEVVLTFDSIHEVNFKAQTNMTSYPTEDNKERIDGKFNQPSTITVRGIIQKGSALTSAVGSALGFSLFEKTKAELEKFIDVVCHLDIQTKNGFYKNYSLVGYEIPESLDNYSYFEVIMDFQQNLVDTESNPLTKNISDLKTQVSGWLSKIRLF